MALLVDLFNAVLSHKRGTAGDMARDKELCDGIVGRLV